MSFSVGATIVLMIIEVYLSPTLFLICNQEVKKTKDFSILQINNR